MSKSYILLTLGPGATESPEGRLIVVEYPGFRVVDQITRRNGVFEKTHKGICGASLCSGHGDADFVATMESEVFLGNLAPLKIGAAATHHCFNDLHHAAYGKGEIAVANAGCDSVEILSPQLEHLRTVALVPLVKTGLNYLASLTAEEIRRFVRRLRGGGASYTHLNKKRYFSNFRKAISSKWTHRPGKDMRFHDLRPHFLHPNHVYFNDQSQEWAVTLFRAGQQIGLNSGNVIASGLARPHDGVFDDEDVIFTESSTSTISIRSRTNPENERQTIEVFPEGKKGFLRGVARFENQLFAGLTARRGREYVSHARIAKIQLETGEITETWNIPQELGCQVYSVLDVTSFYSS